MVWWQRSDAWDRKSDSEKVAAEEAAAALVAKVAASKQRAGRINYGGVPVGEFRARLRDLGLSSLGRKADLLARLREAAGKAAK